MFLQFCWFFRTSIPRAPPCPPKPPKPLGACVTLTPRFYAKLAELRQRIRANSMPVLNKEELEESPASPHTTASLPRPARKSLNQASPRVTNPRLPSLQETQQLSLELREQEFKPPLPPKPSPPPYSNYIIAPQPFRRPLEPALEERAPNTNHSLAQQALESWWVKKICHRYLITFCPSWKQHLNACYVNLLLFNLR